MDTTECFGLFYLKEQAEQMTFVRHLLEPIRYQLLFRTQQERHCDENTCRHHAEMLLTSTTTPPLLGNDRNRTTFCTSCINPS